MIKRLKRKLTWLTVVVVALSMIVGLLVIPNLIYFNVLEESALRIVVYKEDGTNFGSAVIFDQDETYYYALTNDHVVSEYLTVNAIDYENNRYVAYVIDSNSSYDLAVLRIEKDIKLKVMKFADDFSVYDEITAVGYPSSIYQESNGSIRGYETINYDINFAVIIHTADIQKGSSGGALVNQDHELVGINFAGYFEDNTLTEGYAIPINQVETYLEAIEY